jgi:hypothetical protein
MTSAAEVLDRIAIMLATRDKVNNDEAVLRAILREATR